MGGEDMDQPVQPNLKSIELQSKVSLTDIYAQALTSMRATDDISLRLLAAVPFVSGIGITLLVRGQSESFPAAARLLVSLFAAVVTFAIYRWERRNISHCGRLRRWAAEVESTSLREMPTEPDTELRNAPHGDPRARKIFGITWRKTEAEALLYITAMVGWIAAGLYVVVTALAD
jgi:hypothetical protein